MTARFCITVCAVTARNFDQAKFLDIPGNSSLCSVISPFPEAVGEFFLRFYFFFINDPDDSKALEKLFPELKKNFEMLVELQKSTELEQIMEN